MVKSSRPDLVSKLEQMRVLDSNPHKPVVRMAHLCVVSSHTVNGVAELHSDILKRELFSDFCSLWPNKFQNKTNGVTPRRWLCFCSPELSAIITKWLQTDKWVTNLDLLAGLRQVCKVSRSLSPCHPLAKVLLTSLLCRFCSLRMMNSYIRNGRQQSLQTKFV
jgi:glucan phosphorylase